jgi:predicted dehydrogenase
MEHFWHWRCYWNYGTGVAGDLLSHEIDFAHAILGHGIPDTCVCLGQNTLLHDGREVPDTWNTIYGFEKSGCVVTFNCSMNTGEPLQPPEFRGKEAYLKFDSIAQSVSTFDVVAEPTSKKYAGDVRSGKIKRGQPFRTFDPSKTPEQPHHMQDFINCVRSRKRPKCHEDEAFIETATFLMSIASYKEKRQVRWDPQREEIV